MTDTHLAQALEATHDTSSYDTNVKFLLADKQILARILKYAVQEFKEMPIEDIMASIGEDIEIGTRPVDAGLSNLGRVKTYPVRKTIFQEREKSSLISVLLHTIRKRK